MVAVCPYRANPVDSLVAVVCNPFYLYLDLGKDRATKGEPDAQTRPKNKGKKKFRRKLDLNQRMQCISDNLECKF